MKQYRIAIESKVFAIMILSLYDYLTNIKNYEIAKQIIRSWTSIWANVAESQRAVSRKDFIHKLSISLKEANETKYWLEILHEAWYLHWYPDYEIVYEKCKEMIGVLTNIINKTNRNTK
jgi:four helix bundle protein